MTSVSSSTMFCSAGSGRSWQSVPWNLYPLCLGQVHEASWSREAFHDFHPHDLEHDGEANTSHDMSVVQMCTPVTARPTTPSSLPRRLQSEMGHNTVVARGFMHPAMCRPI